MKEILLMPEPRTVTWISESQDRHRFWVYRGVCLRSPKASVALEGEEIRVDCVGCCVQNLKKEKGKRKRVKDLLYYYRKKCVVTCPH